MPPLLVHQQQLQLRWLLFVATLAAVAHSGYGAHCFVVLHFWPNTTPVFITPVDRSGWPCSRANTPDVLLPTVKGLKSWRSQVQDDAPLSRSTRRLTAVASPQVPQGGCRARGLALWRAHLCPGWKRRNHHTAAGHASRPATDC